MPRTADFERYLRFQASITPSRTVRQTFSTRRSDWTKWLKATMARSLAEAESGSDLKDVKHRHVPNSELRKSSRAGVSASKAFNIRARRALLFIADCAT